MSEFLNMGGYAIYVWSAYAVTAVVLIANIAHALIKKRKHKRESQKRQ